MKTILVVDDEFLVADVLAFALEDEGFRVIPAGNGRRALELIELERPALVITDYMMPIMNGLELAEAVRNIRGDQLLPIVLISGAQGHLARRATGVFTSVFDKPFRIAEIVRCVHALLSAAP